MVLRSEGCDSVENQLSINSWKFRFLGNASTSRGTTSDVPPFSAKQVFALHIKVSYKWFQRHQPEESFWIFTCVFSFVSIGEFHFFLFWLEPFVCKLTGTALDLRWDNLCTKCGPRIRIWKVLKSHLSFLCYHFDVHNVW